MVVFRFTSKMAVVPYSIIVVSFSSSFEISENYYIFEKFKMTSPWLLGEFSSVILSLNIAVLEDWPFKFPMNDDECPNCSSQKILT